MFGEVPYMAIGMSISVEAADRSVAITVRPPEALKPWGVTFSSGDHHARLSFGDEVTLEMSPRLDIDDAARALLTAVRMLAKKEGFEVHWPQNKS